MEKFEFIIVGKKYDINLAKNIALLHYNNIKYSFMSSLGLNFLKVFYKFILSDPFSITIIVKVNEDFGGYVVFNKNVSTINKRFLFYLIRKEFLSFPQLLIPLLRNIMESLNSFFYPKKLKINVECELISIALVNKYRNMGVGKKLVEVGENILKELGVKKYKVLVYGDEELYKFYRKIGMQKMGTIELHKGKISTIYIKEIK